MWSQRSAVTFSGQSLSRMAGEKTSAPPPGRASRPTACISRSTVASSFPWVSAKWATSTAVKALTTASGRTSLHRASRSR